MILQETVDIIINPAQKSHFIKIGYKNISYTEKITISVNDLPKSSHIEIFVKCDVCSKEKMIQWRRYNQSLKKYDYYSCSPKCSKGKAKKSYGILNKDGIIDKIKKTWLDKYGVSNPNKLESVKNKRKKTNLDKYGVENVFQSEEVKTTIKTTNLKNHGVDHLMKLEETVLKIKNTNLQRYGDEIPLRNKEILDKSLRTKKINYLENLKKYDDHIIGYNEEENSFIFECSDCGEVSNIERNLYHNRKKFLNNFCLKCNPINERSNSQNDITDWIETKNISIEKNTKKIISPYELDIFIPDMNIAIEFNGLYWHSELYKDKNYHLRKTELCEESGIQLMHIWEDDWLYKQDIVKSMILNKLGETPDKIYARKTEIREITNTKLVSKFLTENHLQGRVGSKIKLGLFYENKLVSLMTFGDLRKNLGQKSEEGSYEMMRFCNVLNTNVVGGASRLFKYFIKNYKPLKIISYASRDHSMGKLYEMLGFELDSTTKPNYYYIKDGVRYNRFGFRKDILIKEGYDPNKTEHEIMLERGYYKLYNSGNLKWIIYSEKI